MEGQVLEGVKVADFSWIAAGPLTTLYLAAHGATVVRVESMRRPDGLRTSGPFKDKKPGINRSGYYAYFNANKYSLALNMTSPRAMPIVRPKNTERTAHKQQVPVNLLYAPACELCTSDGPVSTLLSLWKKQQLLSRPLEPAAPLKTTFSQEKDRNFTFLIQNL